MGAICWAIRGTNGWGGIDGTIVPGMTWAILWYYLCQRNGIDARGIMLWLGLGISLGGELGYGQYVSWIQGQFRIQGGVVPIDRWVGYAWFVIAGIGWGATGGVVLGWALSDRQRLVDWLPRLFVPILIAYAGWCWVQRQPSFFFPHYDPRLYASAQDDDLSRTVYTNTQNAVVAAWWLGCMIVAMLQKDRATLVAGGLIGGGFGVAFAASATWCIGYSIAPKAVDWWKLWEMNAGFFLGVLYATALRWAVNDLDRRNIESANTPHSIVREYLKRGSLALTVIILLGVLVMGVSMTLGSLLGFYDSKTVDQYSWPPARVFLALAAAVLLAGGVGFGLWSEARQSRFHNRTAKHSLLAARIVDLMTLIGVVGAVSIWPEKAGVLYAVFLAIALHAFFRLNRRLDAIDSRMTGSRDAPVRAVRSA